MASRKELGDLSEFKADVTSKLRSGVDRGLFPEFYETNPDILANLVYDNVKVRETKKGTRLIGFSLKTEYINAFYILTLNNSAEPDIREMLWEASDDSSQGRETRLAQGIRIPVDRGANYIGGARPISLIQSRWKYDIASPWLVKSLVDSFLSSS